MTRDDITRMFHEAGEAEGWKPGLGNELVINYLTHFAALVAAAEREACARIADAELNPYPPEAPVSQYQSGIFTAAEHIAEAIRARGETK